MIGNGKIVYSLIELRSIRENVKVSESPIETSPYHALTLNRITSQSSEFRKRNGNNNGIFSSEKRAIERQHLRESRDTNPNQNYLHSQSLSPKQQMIPDTRFLGKSSNEPLKNLGSVKSLNHKERVNSEDRRLEIRLGTSSENVRNRDGGSSGGGTSAEQQRLQFEREREQIVLDRQKTKQKSSEGMNHFLSSEPPNVSVTNINRVTTESTTGSYHNDCDLLMIELANNDNSNGNVTRSHNTEIKARSEGPSLHSPPGTKKVSLDSIFASSSSTSQSVTSLQSIIPVADLNMNGRGEGIGNIFSQGSATENSVHQRHRFEEEGHIGDSSIDEDFEAHMRLIERMVFDDKEDDRDDNNHYETSSQIHPSSQYSFVDSLPLPSTNEFKAEQHASSEVIKSPSVSLSVNSLFSAAKLKSEGGRGIVQISHPQSRSYSVSSPSLHASTYIAESPDGRGRSFSDRSASFDVLSKLGFESQMLEQKQAQTQVEICQEQRRKYSEGQEYLSSPSPAPLNNSFSHLHSPPSTLSYSRPSQDILDDTNEKVSTGSTSPFAFHSNNSGGSSGGGSRRGNGNGNFAASAASSSSSFTSPSAKDARIKQSTPKIGGGARNSPNISASSRLQLMKMLKSPGSTPVKSQTHSAMGHITGNTKSSNNDCATPIKASVIAEPLGGAKSEKMSPMQRINISDLFKVKS